VGGGDSVLKMQFWYDDDVTDIDRPGSQRIVYEFFVAGAQLPLYETEQAFENASPADIIAPGPDQDFGPGVSIPLGLFNWDSVVDHPNAPDLVLTGDNGPDTLEGGDGFDTIDGGRGDDEIRGGEGYDDLKGGVGNDFLSGENGEDFLRGGVGEDTLDGGRGDDQLRANAMPISSRAAMATTTSKAVAVTMCCWVTPETTS